VSPSNGSLALRCGSTTSAQPTKRDLLKAHTLTDFLHLGLSTPILKALQAEGYETPTPIQAKAIPVVLAARDVLGIAQTGTGKTAAFAVPIIQRLATDRRHAPRKGCRVLVLSPTRQLATQIAQSFRTYGRNLDLTVAVVFGRRGASPQIQAMARAVDVLVAAPGRHRAAAIGMARNGATFLVPRPRPDIPAAAHRERTARRARRG
jgi:superfamily II DNA/RNA helicase